MNINDLLNLDIRDVQKMTRNELAKAVSTLGSAANKRVKRQIEKDISSPAVRGFVRAGGLEPVNGEFKLAKGGYNTKDMGNGVTKVSALISVKGKNINQLRSEYVRAKTFLNAKTSTIKGFKQVQKEFETRIGGKLTTDEQKDFWSAYNKLSELEPNFLKLFGSDRMQQYLRNEMTQNPGRETDALVKVGKDRLEEMYRQIEEEYNSKEGGINGVSDFFELGEDL